MSNIVPYTSPPNPFPPAADVSEADRIALTIS